MSISSEADLFNALHRAISELATESAPERRSNQRRAFGCQQLLAPYGGQALPAQGDFSLVCCHDLSPSGFSYLADVPPETPQLIAALGRTPFKFFLAEVANERRVRIQGANKIQVGCRFVRRIL